MTIAERNNKLKHFITCLKCEASGKPCDVNCSTQYDTGNMGEIIENLEAISRVLEQDPKTGHWIPVSERLPETDDDVLVYDGVDMFVAWYSLEGMWQGWNSCDDNFDRDTPIIAWMPLPVPYKPESEVTK